MKKEIELAANFLLQLLTAKHAAAEAGTAAPSLSADLQREFLEVCTRCIDAKCTQSWREDFPEWGSAFRAIVLQPDYVDPILVRCAKLLNIAPGEIAAKMAATHLILWVDPDAVSFKMGEKGTIKFLYQRAWTSGGSGDGISATAAAKAAEGSAGAAANVLSCKHQMRAISGHSNAFPLCDAPHI